MTARRIIERFQNNKILVVGDLMLDQYIRGSVSRISPEAPVPVVSVGSESFLPGGAGNVAVNLASLGADVSIIGVVGEDEAGLRLKSEFSAKNIDARHVLVDKARVTSQKCRVIAERQQVIRYDRETAAPLERSREETVLALLPDACRQASAVILSDYGKGMVTPRILRSVISLCRRRGSPIIVDPKVEHFGLYRGVTCITPNVTEAFAGMRRPQLAGQEALVDLGKAILSRLRCESLLITRGPEGMSLFKAGGSVIHIPTQAREVFDVSGAGDTVISVLALGLASGAGILEASRLANCAAGIVVGKLGTASATVAELSASLSHSNGRGARGR